MDQNLLPCVGCKQLKVLKLGDYCVSCALEWHPKDDEYFVVNSKNLDEVSAATGATKKYLNAKQAAAFEKHCSYVVYCIRDEWKEILVNEGFHLPTIMKRLFERENKQ